MLASRKAVRPVAAPMRPMELPKFGIPEPAGFDFPPLPNIEPQPVPARQLPSPSFSAEEHFRHSREQQEQRMRQMQDRMQKQS